MSLEGAPHSSQIKHQRRVRNEATEYNTETWSIVLRREGVRGKVV